MRVIVINPNTSDDITATIAAAARATARPGTEIEALSAPFGAAYIGTHSENVIAGHAVLTALAPFAGRGRCDAALIAAFSDPGLAGARELMPFPVIGIAQAAMHCACLLASRFSIVTVIPRLVPVFEELAAGYGFERRLASVRAVARPPDQLGLDPAAAVAALRRLAETAIAEDGAEAIVLGGAPLAELARPLAAGLPVPLLEGIACGVGLCEMLAQTGSSGSRTSAPGKASRGLSPDLARLL